MGRPSLIPIREISDLDRFGGGGGGVFHFFPENPPKLEFGATILES
eukprot:COSAG01_NODE_28415_length_661_cov_2.119217_1_plen_45_part_01